MKLETFFEKFELFADAPDAVAKLRELIFNFAATGRLSKFQAGDDSSDGLIDALLETKAEHGANGRRVRTATEVTSAVDRPFVVPSHWAWVPLNEIGAMSGGMTPSKGKPSFWNGDVNWFSSKDIKSDELVESELKITREATEATRLKTYAPGCLVMVARSGILKRTFPVSILRSAGTVNQDLKVLCPYISGMERYLQIMLRGLTSFILESLIKTGMTVQSLKYEEFEQQPFPLPPLAERKRIVAKVDELMALCDRLEAQQQERESRHAALSRAALARFAEAPTPANLEFLFHKSYTIAPVDLRKSIITLAVQGKLISQDADDEPATELSARIDSIRHSMKAKRYALVAEDEAPYEIPMSWSWVRLGNVALTSDSGWSPQCESVSREGTNWGVLKVSAVSWGVFKPEENKALPLGMDGRPGCEVQPGDFLLSRANTEELVARSVVVEQTPPHLMMSDKIVRFEFPDLIDKAYINLANSSEPARSYYAQNASGTSSSMKNVGRDVMCHLPIPLPPLAEQHRIVAKVDELMTLVDKLEAELASVRTTATNLLAAAVAELTNGKEPLSA